MMTLEDKQKLAEDLVDGPVEWDGDRGTFTCPLSALHTSPTKEGHSVCYLDDIPTFYCWHNSCVEWYEEANKALRMACDDRTPEEKRQGKRNGHAKKAAYYYALQVKVQRDEIFKEYDWPDIFTSPLSSRDSWMAFLALWSPGDNLWIGEVYDTGLLKGGRHFKSVEQWQATQINLRGSHFTCASSFLPGTVDRTSKQVHQTKYLVVEFDSLDSDKQENRRKGAALINYLRRSMDLRMVVDSGNKSVHGWFELNDKITEQQRLFLRQLGADMHSMRPAQPVRLPGGVRDNGNIQSILWVP